MKEFEVWMEGYCATGNEAQASFLGKYEAESFDGAVEKMLCDKPHLRSLHETRERYLPRNEDGVMNIFKHHSIWACGLYDNETDARKSFG